jgi:hypothetical protein
MTLIYHEKKIPREVIHKCPRWLSFISPVKMAAIVFNTGAITYLLQHLQIVKGALLYSLSL